MFKWQNPRTGVVHANELLDADTLCGKYMLDDEHPYKPVHPDSEVTCLNCEREVRRLARSGEQYREWLGKPSAWHPRFGPRPSPFAHKHEPGVPVA